MPPHANLLLRTRADGRRHSAAFFVVMEVTMVMAAMIVTFMIRVFSQIRGVAPDRKWIFKLIPRVLALAAFAAWAGCFLG